MQLFRAFPTGAGNEQGTGGGDCGDIMGLYVENVGVRRIAAHFTGSTTELTEVCRFDKFMAEMFETECYQLGQYMIKQYLKVANTISNFGGAGVQVQLLVNGALVAQTFASPGDPRIYHDREILFTEWTMKVIGNYDLYVVIEIVSNRLPSMVVDTNDVDNTWNTIDFVEDTSNRFMSIVLSKIKRITILDHVTIDGTGASDSNPITFFNFAEWLQKNITSPDYLIFCHMDITNLSTEVAYVKSKTPAGRTISNMSISAGTTRRFELLVEELYYTLESATSIVVHMEAQVVANSFDK